MLTHHPVLKNGREKLLRKLAYLEAFDGTVRLLLSRRNDNFLIILP